MQSEEGLVRCGCTRRIKPPGALRYPTADSNVPSMGQLRRRGSPLASNCRIFCLLPFDR